MKNENKAMLVVTLYIVVMLVISVVAITLIRKNSIEEFNRILEATDTREPETNIVYMPIYLESEEESVTDARNFYTVRSYEGKIGVFSDSGKLIEVIDVYIKTLPEADRRQLEEGFIIESEDELRSLVEDYTG